MILWFVLRPKIVNDGQSVFFFLTSRTRPRRTNDEPGIGPRDRRALSADLYVLHFAKLNQTNKNLGERGAEAP